MSTRRSFLKMNLAVVGAGILSPIANSDMDVDTRSVDLIVFDRSIPEANALARRASGGVKLPTGKDLYPVWQDTLKQAIEASPKTIAGLTSGEAVFCLAELAKDYGYELIQSEVFSARDGFDPTLASKNRLTPLELNRPLPVA